MANKTKILLIVEGAQREVELVEKLLQEYKVKVEREIYVYGTNIYELYEKVFLGNEDEMDSIDLLQKLKEKDSNNPILDEKFSDIILIFDYDPQDNRYSEERIKLMLDYFSESTENGKLYINYPMLESYKHFKSFPDEEYIKRKVDFELVKKGKYKEIVGKEAKITKINKFTKDVFNEIIISNIKKANYITSNLEDLKSIKEIYNSINESDVLDIQNNLLLNEKQIYVLNTSVFFICDYNFELILKN